MAKIVHAVVGILQKNNKVLIASRPQGKSHAGCWEFPGGKIEDDESSAAAIVRELKEEIGVIVKPNDVRKFIFIKQPYPYVNVHLDVMWIDKWENDPVANEGQDLFWQPLGVFCAKSPLLLTTQKILDLLEEK